MVHFGCLLGSAWVHSGVARRILATRSGAVVSHVRRFSQSIHLNPDTREGLEILSVLLALPPYRRAALVRTVLAEHLRRAAHDQYPAITPKTHPEIVDMLASRAALASRRTSLPPARAPASGPIHSSDAPQDAPETLDLDARLDQLQF